VRCIARFLRKSCEFTGDPLAPGACPAQSPHPHAPSPCRASPSPAAPGYPNGPGQRQSLSGILFFNDGSSGPVARFSQSLGLAGTGQGSFLRHFPGSRGVAERLAGGLSQEAIHRPASILSTPVRKMQSRDKAQPAGVAASSRPGLTAVGRLPQLPSGGSFRL
jgi:hypothetical protein